MYIRVLFIVTGLGTGGAEKQLARLAPRLIDGGFAVSVIALRGGPVADELRGLGVPVTILGVSGFATAGRALGRLLRLTHSFDPDVIQGWMYHGNLAAALAHRLCARRARLYWGIRQSLYDISREKPLTRFLIRLGAKMSKGAKGIFYNSEVARVQHEAVGYAAARAQVIDNGFDTAIFRPDAEAHRAVRQELGVGMDTPLIGLIARFHAMKGHAVFLNAAARLARETGRVHFLLAGTGVDRDNPELCAWLRSPELAGRLHLLGERHDIPRLTAALDVASSSSSWGEAFPNALGEAMSCGVPCVATDVGDARRILGEAGIVVPAGDAEALARAWGRILALSREARRQMGLAGRRRVEKCFSLERVAAQYAEVYRRNR